MSFRQKFISSKIVRCRTRDSSSKVWFDTSCYQSLGNARESCFGGLECGAQTSIVGAQDAADLGNRIARCSVAKWFICIFGFT